MPTFTLSRSQLIKAPLAQVKATVRDFRSWPRWSPWLVAEPDATLDFAPDGSGYGWDGKFIGSGQITLTKEKAEALHLDLAFFKPWQSKAKASFHFAGKEGRTEVTWRMEGSLPIFLFFMKKMMCRFIEMDYDRGLLMLKDLLERGEVLSKLTFSPRVAVASTPYVGITRECPIAELGDHMEGDFKKLRDWSLDKGLSPCRPPFSIYEKWDLKKGLARYTAAYPLDEIPDELPDGAARGELPACESFVVTHQGSYHHLGNAWTAGMMRAKAKAFRQSRRIMPFETYPNNPDNTAEEDLLALVHFPLK